MSRKETLVEVILDGISDGIPLRQLCRAHGLGVRTWYNWTQADAELAARFAQAREDGFDAIAEDVLQIADTPALGVIEVEKPVLVDGKQVATVKETRHEDMLGHRKLQIYARLQLLAKWDPKRYGDKIEHEHSGGVTITAGKTDEDL